MLRYMSQEHVVESIVVRVLDPGDHFSHIFDLEHHMVTDSRLVSVDPRKTRVQSAHVVKVWRVVLPPMVVQAQIVFDERGGSHEDRIAVDHQVPRRDARNDDSGVQLEQLL